MSRTSKKTLKLVELAIFIAIVFVLQIVGTVFPLSFLGVSLSFVLIPIVVGGILTGRSGGAVLGFVFGIATVVGGLSGMDAFTATLINFNGLTAFWTILLCIVKATAAGFFAAAAYQLIEKKNKYAAVFTAAITAPVVNTGLFVLGSLTVLSDAISTSFAGGENLITFVLIVLAGKNFIAELLINVIFAPAIYSVISAVKKG